MQLRKYGNVFGFMGVIIFLAALVFLSACGDSGENKTTTDTQVVEKTNPGGLTDWEMESGFGPVKKKLNLGPINEELSKEGEAIFDTKCITCHKLDERYTGPAQRDVLQRISPEFFMNMVVNPDENIEKHPRAKKLLAEYMNKMTNQNVTLKDARALLEYFRVLKAELEQNNQTNQ
ncbi:MAG: c-type cytochrome [Ignavibacteriaceae bacterium]|nr:c-type cytochrome [Ignavibacteriaceae bacterium]